MSVDLNVWSNHNIRFNSAEEAIEKFERKTLAKINQWNPEYDYQLKKTRNISEIKYFIRFDFLIVNYEKWNKIRVLTNFEFCDELTLFRKSLRIHPIGFRTRYSVWKKLITGELDTEDSDDLKKMKEHQNNWLQFRHFSQKVTSKLGGDKIIYINDHSYQDEEDLFNQGKSLKEVIIKLNHISRPYELEFLELFPNEFRVKNTWHYEDLK